MLPKAYFHRGPHGESEKMDVQVEKMGKKTQQKQNTSLLFTSEKAEDDSREAQQRGLLCPWCSQTEQEQQ